VADLVARINPINSDTLWGWTTAYSCRLVLLKGESAAHCWRTQPILECWVEWAVSI